jgi:D-inositol-3-phosphate glycosyltransferase
VQIGQPGIGNSTSEIVAPPLIDRVAMISAHTSPVAMLGSRYGGGMNVYINELSHSLASRGIAVDMFTRRTDPVTPRITELADGLRLIQVEAGPPEEVSKDSLFCHMPEFASEMVFHALREGIQYDVVHAHYWLSGWAAHLLREHWRAPYVQMFHTMAHLKNAVAGAAERETTLRLQVERRLVELSDAIIAANPHERADMINRLGAPVDATYLVPAGVDLDRFRPYPQDEARRELDLPDNPLILFVGRIDPVKGIDTLFRAFQKLVASRDWLGRDPKLVFIGGLISTREGSDAMDDDLQELARSAEELGVLDHVLFRGSQARDRLPLYYSAVDVCAVPSRYESFGLVAVEAMACGTPIVASRVGGLQFTIEHEQSGLLVPHSDPDALAAALLRALTDEVLYARLCDGAREVAEQFSWRHVTSSVINVYERLSLGAGVDLCCPEEAFAS